MKVTSLRYLDAKFHHPSLGASPPNRGNRISCVQNSRKMENRNSVNNSGIGILCSKNSNERLAVPAVAGLLVLHMQEQWSWEFLFVPLALMTKPAVCPQGPI